MYERVPPKHYLPPRISRCAFEVLQSYLLDLVPAISFPYLLLSLSLSLPSSLSSCTSSRIRSTSWRPRCTVGLNLSGYENLARNIPVTPLSATRLSFLRAVPLRASIKPELTKEGVDILHDPCDSSPPIFLLPLTFPISSLLSTSTHAALWRPLLCSRPFVSNCEAGTFSLTGSTEEQQVLSGSAIAQRATLPPTFHWRLPRMYRVPWGGGRDILREFRFQPWLGFGGGRIYRCLVRSLVRYIFIGQFVLLWSMKDGWKNNT